MCERFHAVPVVAWIDNEASRYALMKGTADSVSLRNMARLSQHAEITSPSLIWYERVASFSNPADLPSKILAQVCFVVGRLLFLNRARGSNRLCFQPWLSDAPYGMDHGLQQPQMLFLILSCVITTWGQSGPMSARQGSRAYGPAKGVLSIELRCVSSQGPLTASSSVHMREGAQITGLGAEAGPTPAARATQAHGPEYPATLAVLAFSSCQDQLEHPTARSQPLSCVRALNVLTGHAVSLQRAALLPRCAQPCSFHVLQSFVTSGTGRVPNMSAPGSSDGQDGRKAKRDFPRSHFRADGTRRRTAGEKQARKSWSRRQDADDQHKWRQPAENRPQWRKKDSAQETNEGWGVNLHTSGASAGQRQQPLSGAASKAHKAPLRSLSRNRPQMPRCLRSRPTPGRLSALSC